MGKAAMKNPRLAVREAVKEAERVGIKVRFREKDGHYLFFLPRGIVSVAGGRREEVPPMLAMAIRRADAKDAQGSD